jgi:hypothetical protein
MNTVTIPAILLFLCLLPPNALSQSDSALKIPAEIKSFIEKGAKAIALESADLNGDGTMDFILVTELVKPEARSDEDNGDERALFIIVRDAGGKLTLSKRNDEVVYCKSCGGVFGDPFAGVEARRNGFTINNYGGSAWRWSESYRFNYSRIDKT